MNIKRAVLPIVAAVAAWSLTTAMGRPPGQDIPQPEIDFRVTVRDDQDIPTKLNHASWDGNTYIAGTRGKAAVTISFEKIKKVAATGTGGTAKKDFQVTLRSGEVVAVTLDDESRLLGATNFGTYRISAKNVKEIVFEEFERPAPKETPKPVVKETPKEAVKEAPKPAVKETPKEAAKEAPKEAVKEATGVEARPAVKEVVKEAPADAPVTAPKEPGN